jgi:hypothetical protein
MIKTSHDLCANTAKLNLNELIKTAEIAVARSRWDCEQALQQVQIQQVYSNKDKWQQTYAVANAAHDLSRAANDLAQAANTLHYLLHAQDREKITVEKS